MGVAITNYYVIINIHSHDDDDDRSIDCCLPTTLDFSLAYYSIAGIFRGVKFSWFS